MALKSYKPTTPGQRGLVLIDRSELWKGRPLKALTEGISKHAGRNNTGRITMRRKGGGAKRLYRKVDFKRNKMDMLAVVERIEYDPNRTAFIALVKYDDGELSYIIAPQRLAIGDKIISANKADIKPGNTMPFTGMPIGSIVHNIELKPGKGRANRAVCWHLCSIHRARWCLRANPPVFGRAADCSPRMVVPRLARFLTPTMATRIWVRRGAIGTRGFVLLSVVL